MRRNILILIILSWSVLGGVTALTLGEFSDQEINSENTFSTGTWATPSPQAKIVINEVYYDVDATHGGDGNAANPDEWIELYNAGDAPADLKDWTITDNTTVRTIHVASHILPADTYALIAKDHSTFSLYWNVPEGTDIIELGRKIGNGLGNDGDRLILKDDQDNIVDQISWGEDSSILNPAIPNVDEGHSLERQPPGQDSDAAADFADRLIPTPGG